jgi:hypothetical protein
MEYWAWAMEEAARKRRVMRARLRRMGVARVRGM